MGDCAETEIHRMNGITKDQEARLHYYPLMVGPVRLLFTDYDTENRTCQIHFDCDEIVYPVEVFRKIKRVLSEIGKNGDIDLLYAYPIEHRTLRLAESLSFKWFATVDEKHYLVFNLKNEVNHGNESNEDARTKETGGTDNGRIIRSPSSWATPA